MPNSDEVEVSTKTSLHRPFLKMLVFLQLSVHKEAETTES